MEVNCEMMSVVACTLANGGVCPTTGERVFSTATVRNCLSLMGSSGMYGYSGEFAFSMGFPAKAGASGAVMIVIPNIMGICTWSPPLDKNGNSARGVEFCRLLTERYEVHQFDRLRGVAIMKHLPGTATPPLQTSPTAGGGGKLPPGQRPAARRRRHSYSDETPTAREAADGDSGGDGDPAMRREAAGPNRKKDLTMHKGHSNESQLSQLAYAALKGDLKTMQTLQSLGVDMGGADYDGRTALHVAAGSGILASVEFLLNAGVPVGPIDRWGDNPIAGAERAHHVHTATLLAKWGAQAKADGLREKLKRARGKLLMAVRLGLAASSPRRKAKKGGSLRKKAESAGRMVPAGGDPHPVAAPQQDLFVTK